MYDFCTHDVYGLLIRAMETFVRTFLQTFSVCVCLSRGLYTYFLHPVGDSLGIGCGFLPVGG